MEGYKDLKIHLNINVNLTMENPNSQASIGTLGSLKLNNMKYNPAVMSGIQTLFMVFLFVILGNLVNHWIEDSQSDDDLTYRLGEKAARRPTPKWNTRLWLP